MKNTCEKEKCPMWKSNSVDSNYPCVNYIESWFTQSDKDGKPTGTPLLVYDCIPRRTLLLLQQLTETQVGIQQASEQQRNSNIGLIRSIVDAHNSGTKVQIVVNDQLNNNVKKLTE